MDAARALALRGYYLACRELRQAEDAMDCPLFARMADAAPRIYCRALDEEHAATEEALREGGDPPRAGRHGGDCWEPLRPSLGGGAVRGWAVTPHALAGVVAGALLFWCGFMAGREARQAPGEIKGTLERVVDGDTVLVAGQRVRLFGVDAFEHAQACAGGRVPCGWLSADHLGRLKGEHLSCAVRSIDRYHRPVAVCVTDSGTDLGAFQVLSGWALAYKRYSHDYTAEEDAARWSKAGAWAGDFEAPWDWREHKP